MKYNIITHITTSCNYNCSYCDVIKDKKNISNLDRDNIISFINFNKSNINNFKFFWWEPLLAFNDIKYIINKTKDIIWNNFEIVTNTSLLNDEIGIYFENYFKIIFFSIDSENYFDYNKINNFILKYNLKNKIYFNIVVSPWFENIALEQFKLLYNKWIRWFNILPVYFTKKWSKENLKKLSEIIKIILNKSILDDSLKLFGFQENLWKEISLINESLFIDINWSIYYSDIVSTELWQIIKDDLFLWKVDNYNLIDLNQKLIVSCKNNIFSLEQKICNEVKWQKELKKIMDYFSSFLNDNKWIIKE